MAKNEIKREDLIDKNLEELILSRDEQHDYLSINIPVIISCLWVIISIIFAINPQIRESYPKIVFYWIMIIIFTIFIFIALKITRNKWEQVENNLKIYDKVILEKIEEYKKAEQDYKDNVMKTLDELKSKKQ